MLFAAILQLLLSYEVSAFLAGRTASSSSTFLFRVQQTATDDIITATNNEGALDNSATSDIHHAVIGSTQLHPEPRNLGDFPALQDAFLTGTHPELSEDEEGRGTFIMADWRKAWYTYGQCDRDISQEEYERIKSEGGFVVDPFTGEAEYEIEDIEGTLPDDLVGVLFRVGPGKFGVDGQRVAHILDADGLVLRFEIKPPEDGTSSSSRVKFTSRFVETEGFIEERDAKQFTKRGTFGTAPHAPLFGEPSRRGLNNDPEKLPLLSRVAANALKVDIKNTANTQLIAFGGKLLALWEAGMPYELDPVTLKTLGQEFLGNPDLTGKMAVNYLPLIPENMQPDMLGGLAHTAHPKICPRTGHLVGWTWAQNPADGSMEVTLTEYNSDGFQVVASQTHTLPDCALAPHDMVLTEHFLLLKFNALEMDQTAFLSGAKGPAECLVMDGRAPVKVQEKKEFAPFVVENIPACFSIHFSHGYEDEKTGNIVSYFSGWPPNDSTSFLGAWGGFCPDYHQIPVTFYWRMEIDPTTKQCVDLRVSPGAENVCCEHPVVHPNFQTKDATFAYAQCCNVVGDASAPMGYTRLRLDGTAPVQNRLKEGEKNDEVDYYEVGPRRFTGEPLVVPKQGGDPNREEDAYLLGLVFDAVEQKSSLVVFDLENKLKDGPVCSLTLNTALPHGLHGCFSPDTNAETSYFC